MELSGGINLKFQGMDDSELLDMATQLLAQGLIPGVPKDAELVEAEQDPHDASDLV